MFKELEVELINQVEIQTILSELRLQLQTQYK